MNDRGVAHAGGPDVQQHPFEHHGSPRRHGRGSSFEQYSPSAARRRAPSDDSLPAGWKAVTDKSTGDTYYYNRTTKATQWTRPIGEKYQLPRGWREIVDKLTGKKYYYNKSLNKTQWHKPTATAEALAERERLHNMMQSMNEAYATHSSGSFSNHH